MFKNHLKIAFRQLARNKAFATLNILGLSLGMALAILIITFINNEFQHDRWIKNNDQTYRVYRIGQRAETAWTPTLLARKLVSDYPEVINAAAWRPLGEYLVTYAGNNWYIEETAIVDSTFFKVVEMDFLHGDATALSTPNGIVLSQKLAKQIFGDANPIGEMLTLGSIYEYIVTGVLDNTDKLSHVNSDFFIRYNGYGTNWSGNNRATYVQLKPNADPSQLAVKIENDVNELIRQEHLANNYTPKESDFFKWALQPLSQVYLHSEGWTNLGNKTGSIRNVYIFAFIAFLVIIVAIINYVNLTTAKASQRGKEVGVKKVMGARKGFLMIQFLIESVLQSLLAGMLAVLIAELCLPFFNRIMNRELQVVEGAPGSIFIGTMILAFVIGLIAGIYPAFVMSNFNPTTALKSSFLKTGENGLFRKVLVTSQFAVTITLLIVMAFIYRQVNFMLNKDLGFQADQVLTIPMNEEDSHRRVTQLKNKFKQIPSVQEVTSASHFPGYFLYDWGTYIEGKEERYSPYVLFADADFGKALSLDMEMVQGRFFDTNFSRDTINNYVVNETFVKTYNIAEPIGLRMRFAQDEEFGQIVGVIKDFHFHDVTRVIEPLVMSAGNWRNHVGIKLSTKNLPQTIEAIKTIWSEIEPNYPMRYSFLDEDFSAQYVEQQRFGKSILYATLLTLFIALLGLFGLTAFTVERRNREIGIRKVLGASVNGIIALLAKDFMKLIGFACVIALPLSYLITNRWLADFAHRTDLVWWVFAGAGLLILGIGFLTVGLQSMRAALRNPVDVLRTE